ncbi:MAG: hypothetical protein JNK04_11820 [Myxococcales bacterium]|nr:hypothetical protein [Myxococcales bacterium]
MVLVEPRRRLAVDHQATGWRNGDGLDCPGVALMRGLERVATATYVTIAQQSDILQRSLRAHFFRRVFGSRT